MSSTRNPLQLLLIKHLYDDACLLVGREDDLAIMKAVLSLDQSVEQMLNTIIMDFTSINAPKGRAGRKDVGWGEIWDRASGAMKTLGHELLNHAQLLTLHEVRNLAHHNGSIPTQAEVKRYIQPAEEMLTSAFRDLYGADFQTFRLWDLVPNEGLRQLLRDSEYALEKGYPVACIVGCNLAHSLVIKAIRNYTKLRRFRVSQVFSQRSEGRTALPASIPSQMRSQIQQASKQIDTAIRTGVAQFRSEIMEEIEFLEDEVVTIGVGMPLMDTRRFQKIGSEAHARINYEGEIIINQRIVNRDDEDTREGARFMLSYLSRMVRLIDEAYPEVVKGIQVPTPLTEHKWWPEAK